MDAIAGYVGYIYAELTDNERKIDEDCGDDEFREGFLDAIVVDADSGELGENDDEEKNNKDDVGKVAESFPGGIGCGAATIRVEELSLDLEAGGDIIVVNLHGGI